MEQADPPVAAEKKEGVAEVPVGCGHIPGTAPPQAKKSGRAGVCTCPAGCGTSASKDSKPERPARWHLLLLMAVALLLAGLRVLPALSTNAGDPGREFLGFPYSIEDSLQYADFVAQAKEDGSLFLSNRFCLDDEEPRLVILPIYALGRLAAWTGLSVAGVWSLGQAIFILAFVWVLYWFLGGLFQRAGVRLFACLFILLAGGLDGFVVLAGPLWPETWAAVLKRDLWVVLGWTPYMSMYNPVYLAGWLVLLPWLRLAHKAMGACPWAALAAAALMPLLYLVHAYDALVAAGVLVLAPLQILLVRLHGRAFLRSCKTAGIALLGVIPTVAIGVWQAGDPLFAKVAAAGHSGLFVSPLIWFLGFGGILAAAFYGLRRLAEDQPRASLLFGWLITSAALSFSPLFEGRHFLYFVSLPLGVLAVDGLLYLHKRFPLSRRGFLVVAGLGLLVFGNSFVRTSVRAFTQAGQDPRATASKGEIRLAEALSHLPPGGVLAARKTCNWLPHRSGQRCVMGHWFLSHDMARTMQRFQRLLAPETSPAERDLLFSRLGARYLFWGPNEAAIGVKPRTDRVRLLPLQAFGGAFLLEIKLPNKGSSKPDLP
jgi:hypothetical protein